MNLIEKKFQNSFKDSTELELWYICRVSEWMSVDMVSMAVSVSPCPRRNQDKTTHKFEGYIVFALELYPLGYEWSTCLLNKFIFWNVSFHKSSNATKLISSSFE